MKPNENTVRAMATKRGLALTRVDDGKFNLTAGKSSMLLYRAALETCAAITMRFPILKDVRHGR
jgi:hypothetical protein